MKATLILANGSIFSGTSIGSTETRVCEMVFNTSMAGYQEILTDPSYAGQGVVMSYPLIGNYGVNHEDCESRRPWVEALVVRHLSPRGSNFRCEGDLGTYLKEHNITGIQGVDTRALTKILRSEGSMNGMLTCAEHFNIAQVLEQLKAYQVKDTVSLVTRTEAEVFSAYGEERLHVAMMDYGVKQNMIECLRRRGCKVTALPASTSAEEVLSGGYDGVMLSNGPGDPAENTAIIAELRKLYDSDIPLFGVCLGHQLLALATGARTGRLAYGHRGGNHPVRDLEKGRVFITSQNHGFMVLADSVNPAVAEVSHINVNDGTCEGLRYKRPNCFTTQFHPEANAGPKDTEYLFNRFIDNMAARKAGGNPSAPFRGGEEEVCGGDK
ncbi:carbamoyl phosphate synthase small subunit [Colidextribacter sp. OB.20]|uniref:carbamoyl phosphate synthase small subunit n=1 Tax=Colidextribacter sp. OB.20 TaxID=2304568 RepID=UPI001367E132|nr:carbamoyl phosphate synthase small subunit [Colidextribacter sp. OB.20]NBI08506.1 carbamoyl phosphate synthase small subunit [Colidextribacter sp. OB.20]